MELVSSTMIPRGLGQKARQATEVTLLMGSLLKPGDRLLPFAQDDSLHDGQQAPNLQFAQFQLEGGNEVDDSGIEGYHHGGQFSFAIVRSDNLPFDKAEKCPFSS